MSINDYQSNLRRIAAWIGKSGVECAVVFDIGTRGARVMVGPKKLPQIWNEDTFCTAGFVTGLGGDVGVVSRRLEVDDSPALLRVAEFINDAMAVLRDNHIPEHNVVAMGTAVFRSLPESNLEEVIAWLHVRTGVRLRVIDGKTEALLALTATRWTHRFGLEQSFWLAKDERLLQIDQGGGSTEISFALPNDLAQLESKSDLGTITLRGKFFGADPESNHATISEQCDRVLDYVSQRVERYEFPDLNFKAAYAVGTAITACFEGASTFRVHNRIVTLSFLEELERERRCSLGAAYSNVADLYRSIEKERTTDDDFFVKKDKEVLVLYGLPVYRMILQKLGMPEIRLCGFALRHGAFLVQHHLGYVI